ncbi:cubilin-like isoform X2 [Physella acuta]|uniref:cubilin-like isoform X2 n=1 Tax=Physella acuta TaxID=109671 RepID=UPI0027DD4BB8|nr:cubilin-like isoform X2 [Physella acuta]
MENKFYIWLLVFVVMVTAASGCDNCVCTEPRGTIEFNAKCQNYTVKLNSTNGVAFYVQNLELINGDYLEIWDNSTSSLKFTKSVDSQVVIGFSNNITLKTKKDFKLNYNTDCQITVQDTWEHQINSPLYLISNNSGKVINCKYTVQCDLPVDRTAAASFQSLLLKDNSTLIVETDGHNNTFDASSKPEDFFPGTTNFNLTWKVNANRTQQFSLLMEPVLSACSGSFNNDSYLVNLTIQPALSSVCRWKFESTKTKVVVSVKNLTISNGNDLLSFFDGGDSYSPAKNSLSSFSDGYLFLPSDTKTIVQLTLGNTAFTRTIEFSVQSTDVGGPLSGAGSLLINKGQASEVVYYQLSAEPGKVLKVSVDPKNVFSSTVVTFYNGLQTSDGIVYQYKVGSLLTDVIGGAQMLVAVQNVASNETFNATFASIPKGCDELATADSGSWNIQTTTSNCTYTIFPYTSNGTLIVTLDAVTVTGPPLVIYDGLVAGSKVLAQFSTSQTTAIQIFGSANEAKKGIRVFVPTKNSVSLRYTVSPAGVCGGALGTKGTILTPNYPSVYPLNARCQWTVPAKSPQLLYLNFDKLDLAKDHSITVLNDTTPLQVFVNQPCLPADYIVEADANISVVFQSNNTATLTDSQTANGANITYLLLECGGNLRKEGSFNSTVVNKLCVWSISVRNGTEKNVVKFTISTNNTDELQKSLSIHDGDSVRSPPIKPINGSAQLSSADVILVKLDTATGFNFTFTFSTESSNSTTIAPPTTTSTTTSPTTTKKPDTGDIYSGWVKSGWVPACLFIGILIGLVLYFVVPRIYRRVRGRSSNYSRMGDDRFAYSGNIED